MLELVTFAVARLELKITLTYNFDQLQNTCRLDLHMSGLEFGSFKTITISYQTHRSFGGSLAHHSTAGRW